MRAETKPIRVPIKTYNEIAKFLKNRKPRLTREALLDWAWDVFKETHAGAVKDGMERPKKKQVALSNKKDGEPKLPGLPQIEV